MRIPTEMTMCHGKRDRECRRCYRYLKRDGATTNAFFSDPPIYQGHCPKRMNLLEFFEQVPRSKDEWKMLRDQGLQAMASVTKLKVGFEAQAALYENAVLYFYEHAQKPETERCSKCGSLVQDEEKRQLFVKMKEDAYNVFSEAFEKMSREDGDSCFAALMFFHGEARKRAFPND